MPTALAAALTIPVSASAATSRRCASFMRLPASSSTAAIRRRRTAARPTFDLSSMAVEIPEDRSALQ